MIKYRLTDETKVIENAYSRKTLYRIQAIVDFGDVKAGELGGFIEKESNLSQDGLAWVYDDAMVYGNALATDNARVKDRAMVYDRALISDIAVVMGRAEVYNRAMVYGNARVGGNAWIMDDTMVYDNAKVSSGYYDDGRKLTGDTDYSW